MQRMVLAAAGAMGALGVAAAAWSQHQLIGSAEHAGFALMAARFALLHAAVLVGIAAVLGSGIGSGARTCLGVAAACFFAGFILFCGGLWLLAAGVAQRRLWGISIPASR